MRRTIAGVLAAGLLLAGCASEAPAAQTVTATATTTATEVETSTKTPEPAGTVTEMVTTVETHVTTETTTAPPPGPVTAFTDGTFIVGKDIQPGTYQADGTEDCYWVRKTQAGDIIDNDFGTVMTVQTTDYLVQTKRCGNWALVG